MFRPKYKAIFRMMFEQAECIIDKDFNLRDLVLQEYNFVYGRIILYIFYIIFSRIFNTAGMSHLKITVSCVYGNDLWMVDNYLFETCRG